MVDFGKHNEKFVIAAKRKPIFAVKSCANTGMAFGVAKNRTQMIEHLL